MKRELCLFCGTDLEVEREMHSFDRFFTEHSCAGTYQQKSALHGVRQQQEGTILLGKGDNSLSLLKKALLAGYGEFPAGWAFKLYLNRN